MSAHAPADVSLRPGLHRLRVQQRLLLSEQLRLRTEDGHRRDGDRPAGMAVPAGRVGRITLLIGGSADLRQAEPAAVVLEVEVRVPVDLGQRHPRLGVRIPARREGYPSPEGGLGLTLQPTLQAGDGAVAEAAEDQVEQRLLVGPPGALARRRSRRDRPPAVGERDPRGRDSAPGQDGRARRSQATLAGAGPGRTSSVCAHLCPTGAGAGGLMAAALGARADCVRTGQS